MKSLLFLDCWSDKDLKMELSALGNCDATFLKEFWHFKHSTINQFTHYDQMQCLGVYTLKTGWDVCVFLHCLIWRECILDEVKLKPKSNALKEILFQVSISRGQHFKVLANVGQVFLKNPRN